MITRRKFMIATGGLVAATSVTRSVSIEQASCNYQSAALNVAVTEVAFQLPALPAATGGEIAIQNLQSTLQRSWNTLRCWPDRPNTAERILDGEQFRVQFLGDVTALDRLATLSSDLSASVPNAASTHMVAARVASILHHFTDAKTHLTEAEACGASTAITGRALLAIKQASGEDLASVLAARRDMAETSGDLQDLVPLGALLADLGEFEEADQIYLKAFQRPRDVSPYGFAWVCFQLGELWGEIVPEPEKFRAAIWYQRAVEYLPAYTTARVHLAEILIDSGDLAAAEAWLLPVIASGDPEVQWKLAEVLAGQNKLDEADIQRNAARSTYEQLLSKYELAFADHAAEFYLSTGDDVVRACELARINLTNRQTLRAFELAYHAANQARDDDFSNGILMRASLKLGHTHAFKHSALANPSKTKVLRTSGTSLSRKPKIR
jgi:tetratricopeptide (TPR) repeat protein